MFYRQLDDESQLRLLHPCQADAIFAAVDGNREHLRRWLPWVDGTASVADSHAFIRSSLARLPQDGTFDASVWHRDELVGMIGLFDYNARHRHVEIGYWLAEGAQGQGLMTQACRAMTSYAFGALDVERVIIHAAAQNTRSRAVAERLGFVYEGTLRRHGCLRGLHMDHTSYGALRGEWATPDPVGPLGYPLGDGAELRLFTPRDAQAFFDVTEANRAHIGAWMSWVDLVPTREAAAGSMRKMAESYPDSIHAGVFVGDRLVGGVSAMGGPGPAWASRQAELAYWLAQDAEGRGLVTRGCRAMLDFLFGTLKLERVSLRAAPGNPRSRAVAERLGFVLEATQRHACLLHGQYHDLGVFAQLREEWEAGRHDD